MADKPPRARSKSIPPTVEEVRVYCEERHNGIDPQRFVDYYTANGWVQGKGNPVKDWKACVRTWEARERDKTKQATARQKNDTAGEIKARRELEKAVTYSQDDFVERPDRPGEFCLRGEIEHEA